MEALVNTYPSDQIQALAIDTWDGGENQVNVFQANAGTQFPILMYGGQAGILSDYNCNYDYFFIIGGDGIIKWRGKWNEADMTTAIDAAIAELSLAPVEDVPASGHRLLANYPNPFNPMTRIPYDLALDGAQAGKVEVRLEILDVRGRLVKTLVQGRQATGQRYEVMWDGNNEAGQLMSSGTYMSRLRIDGIPQTRFLTLIK